MSLRSLLVVDDDPAVLDLVTSVLARQDRHITGSYDGSTALEEIRREPYEIAIAGAGRDGLDSLDLLREIRGASPATRVIILDSHSDPLRAMSAARGQAYSFFHKPLPPGPMADMVQQALDAAPDWQDDIHVLSASPALITVAVRCRFEAGDRLTQFLREALADVAPAVRDDVVAAFRELAMNSIEHGGHADPAQWVQASVIRTAHAIVAHLQDPGPGFSMSRIPHAAISNPLDSPIRHAEIRAERGQRPGGFGILMTKNMVDELIYSDCGNEAVIVKYL